MRIQPTFLKTIMKKRTTILAAAIALIMIAGCKPKAVQDNTDYAFLADTIILDADQYVSFETNKGTFVIKLYRETPLHRHNMVRNARHGIYDGQLFFGVEKNYKIQCGDVKSKGAAPGVALGTAEEFDTIRGEINPAKFYHKRGAVGQASIHQYDYSTSQQFYIITGTKHNASDLPRYVDKYNKRVRKAVKDSLTQPYAKQILEYKNKGYNNKISVLNDKLNKETDAILKTRKQFDYSKEQVNQYTQIGGAPSLDGLYTVFGEIVEGMDVIETIEKSHIDKNRRPNPDVKIIKATVLE